MAEILASEAKLKISLDTTQAQADLKEMEAASPAATGEGPAKPPPSEADQSESVSRPRRSPDTPYDWSQRGKELWGRGQDMYRRAQRGFQVVATGSLYREAVRIGRGLGSPVWAGGLPVGSAVSAAESFREHGALARGITGQLLKETVLPALPEGPAREAARKGIDALMETAFVAQAGLQGLKNKSESLGKAIGAVQALGVAKAIKDGVVEEKGMVDFGMKIYEAELLFTEITTRKRMMFQEMTGEGVIKGLAEAVKGHAGL